LFKRLIASSIQKFGSLRHSELLEEGSSIFGGFATALEEGEMK